MLVAIVSKIVNKGTILSFLLLVSSCEGSLVKFSEAQPEDSKNLKSFPGKLIGTYYDEENKTSLEISKYFIIEKKTFKGTFNIKELSEFEILKNDTVIDSRTSEKTPVKKIGDSIFAVTYDSADTIFRIDHNNILRKMNGYFFLNYRDSKNLWTVKKLILKNGLLNLNNISTKEEIEMLEEITETKKDTARPLIVKPTKKQFKAFVKKNGFSQGKTYLKK